MERENRLVELASSVVSFHFMVWNKVYLMGVLPKDNLCCISWNPCQHPFFFLDGTEFWIQGFALARQSFHHFCYAPTAFWFSYFSDRASGFVQAKLDCDSLTYAFQVAKMIGAGHHNQFDMKVSLTHCPGSPQTRILFRSSVSQVPDMTGTS
jgi:hypothetical protein